MALAAAVALALVAGAGGYLAGHAGGPSRHAAVLTGERDGLRAGASAGHRYGYAAGRSAGETAGYRRAYGLAYEAARRTAVGG